MLVLGRVVERVGLRTVFVAGTMINVACFASWTWLRFPDLIIATRLFTGVAFASILVADRPDDRDACCRPSSRRPARPSSRPRPSGSPRSSRTSSAACCTRTRADRGLRASRPSSRCWPRSWAGSGSRPATSPCRRRRRPSGRPGPLVRATICLVTQAWTSPELMGIGRRADAQPSPTTTASTSTAPGSSSCSAGPSCNRPPTDWRDIEVPGCWTRQETWDLPHYTNVADAVPGPAAARSRRWTRPGSTNGPSSCPRTGSGGAIVLHVGAAESVLLVEVNGARGRDRARTRTSPRSSTSRPSSRPGRNHAPADGREVVRRDVSSRTRTSGGTAGSPARCSCTRRSAVYLADIAAIGGLADDLTTGTLDLTVDIGFARRPRRRPAGRRGARSAAWRRPSVPRTRRRRRPGVAARPGHRPAPHRRRPGGVRRVDAADQAAWDAELRRQAPPRTGSACHWARDPRRRPLDGRDARALHARDRAARARRRGRRAARVRDRLPARGDPRRRPAVQRRARLHPRREPPRLRPAHRTRHLGSSRCGPTWS